MIRLTFFLPIVLAGCTVIQQSESLIDPPQLIRSTSLPPISSVVPGRGMKFNVMILVRKDGTVGGVKLLEPGGDPDWDTLAMHSILNWQFTAARQDGKPLDLWVRQPLRIQLRDPIIMLLAEVVSTTEHDADSLYALFTQGMDFDTLYRLSTQPRGDRRGMIGSVDVSMYAPYVRDQLLKLKEGDVSRPLRFGSGYVIYKRLKKEPV
jgi:TonB family protein